MWEDNSAAITGIALVLAVLLTGSIVSVINNSTIGGLQSSGPDRSYSGGAEYQEASRDLANPPVEDDGTSDSEGRKRVGRVYVDFEAPDVEETVQGSRNEAENFGGYSESRSFGRRGKGATSVSMGMPEGNVSSFLNDLRSDGA
jgi:hypothetical protein